MTGLDVLLVAALAILAIAITVGDLVLSVRRHRRGVSGRRTAPPPSPDSDGDVAGPTRIDAVRRRLAAIQAAEETK